MSENCPLTPHAVQVLKSSMKSGDGFDGVTFQVFEAQSLANGKKFKCKFFDGKEEIMAVITKDIVMKWGDGALAPPRASCHLVCHWVSRSSSKALMAISPVMTFSLLASTSFQCCFCLLTPRCAKSEVVRMSEKNRMLFMV